MTFRELHEVFNRCCTSRNKEKIWEMDKEVAYHSIIERYEDSKTEKCDCIILIYDKILIGDYIDRMQGIFTCIHVVIGVGIRSSYINS